MTQSVRFLALLCFMLVGTSSASGQVRRPISPPRQLSIQPLQLFFREAVVAYEWPVHQRVSLQLGLGYRFNNPSAGPDFSSGINNAYDWRFMFNPHHQAVKLSFGPIFYLNRPRSTYVQLDYFFRHWWVTNRRMRVDRIEPGTQYDVDRTERINVYGLKVLFGVVGQLGPSTGLVSIPYTIFGGVGVRYKTAWYESRNGLVDEAPVDYLLEQRQLFSPSVHLGARTGVGFWGKETPVRCGLGQAMNAD